MVKPEIHKAVYTYNESLTYNKYKTVEEGEVFTVQNVGLPARSFVKNVEIAFYGRANNIVLTYTKADGTKTEITPINSVKEASCNVIINIDDYISTTNVNLLIKNLGKGAARIEAVIVYYEISGISTIDFKVAPYKWENVVIGGGGGFIPRIVFSPIEAGVSYVGTDMGGLYRKKPGESRYVPVTDWVQGVIIQGVESIAVDPVKPGRVYAALGTYLSKDRGPSVIARSDDYGETWAQIVEMPFNMGGNMPGRGAGERLAIDSYNPDILFFGARGGYGLWRSADAGLTWSRVESFPNIGSMYAGWSGEATIESAAGVLWIAFDTLNDGCIGEPIQIIYAGCADGDLENSAYRMDNCIYVSKDGGKSWLPVAGQVKSTELKAGNKNIYPCHSKISGNYLYVTYMIEIGPFSGSEGAVYRLNLTTDEWKDITPKASLISTFPFSERNVGFGGLATDASNPDTIMVSTLNLWNPDEQILRSKDCGETWSPIIYFNENGDKRINKYKIYYNDPKYPESDAIWLDWGKPTEQSLVNSELQPKLGWMIHALEIDPFNPNCFVWGTGATMYGTDELNKWDNWDGYESEKMTVTIYAAGVEECAVLGMTSPTDGAHLISGVGDLYGFVHVNLSKSNKMILPDGNKWQLTVIDYAALCPKIIVAGGENGKKAYAAVSFDYGMNWKALQAAQDFCDIDSGSLSVNADGQILTYAPGMGNSYYMELNVKNPEWTQVIGITGRSRLAADRVNPNTVYAFSEGKIYKSSNCGRSFKLICDNKQLPDSAASCFAAIPGREGHLWLAGKNGSSNNGLWRSVDGGVSFTRVNPELLTDVTAVGFGKARSGSDYETLFIYATIDNVWGIYMSTNQGESWERINDDLHQFANVKRSFITGDMRVFGRVYIGVDGRGVIMGNLNEKSDEDKATDDYTNGGLQYILN